MQRLINNNKYNTRRRLLRFQGFFRFTKNPEAEDQRSYVQEVLNYKTEREHERNSCGVLLLTRVIVNEPPNLEKTTCSVLTDNVN